MRATIEGENLIVEMFDTETKTSHADRLERFEFRLLQCSRLALESNFLCIAPAHVTIKTFNEITQLFIADVRRRAAAEVSKAKLAPFECRHAAVKLVL